MITFGLIQPIIESGRILRLSPFTSCYKWYNDDQSSWLVKVRSSPEPTFSALTLYNIDLKDHIWAITSGKGHDYIWSMNIYRVCAASEDSLQK